MFCKKCNIKIEVGGDLCSTCKENESIQTQVTEDQSGLSSPKGNKLPSVKLSKKHIKMIACIAVGVVLLAGSILLISNVINSVNQPLTIEEILNLGEKYLRDLEFEKALEQFLKAIEIDPRNPRGYTGAAEAYIGLDREQEAIRVLQEGLVLLGDDPSIRRMIDDFAVISDIETPLGASIPRDRNTQDESNQGGIIQPNQPAQPEGTNTGTDTDTEAEPIQNPRQQRPIESRDLPITTNNPLDEPDDTLNEPDDTLNEPDDPPVIPPLTFRVIVRCEYQGVLMNESFTPGSRVNISAKEITYDESYKEIIFAEWLVTNGAPISLNNSTDPNTFFTMPNQNVEILACYSDRAIFDPVFGVIIIRQYGEDSDFDTLFGDFGPGSTILIDAGFVDGFIFSGWWTFDDGIIIDDPGSSVTFITVPLWFEGSVTIFAQFDYSEGEP